MHRIIRSSFRALLLPVALFTSITAFGATSTARLDVLIDSDNDSKTGCTVASAEGRFVGADQLLTTMVTTTGAISAVTSLTRQVCSDASANAFGAPIAIDSTGWPVPVDGASGNGFIETRIPMSALQGAAARIRVGFILNNGSSSTSIFTRANGAPIYIPEAPPEGRRRTAGGGTRTFNLDGSPSDWNGMAPLVSGSASAGSDVKLLNVYAYETADQIYFRFDANFTANGNSPGGPPPEPGQVPTSQPDSYTVVQGHSLNVGAPGVLLNDTNPLSGSTMTAIQTLAPLHGTLVLNADGSFSYLHDGSFSTTDSFRYKAHNSAGDSAQTIVTITVAPNTPPNVVADTYNVAHGGTLNVPPPGVLSNDSDFEGDALTALVTTTPLHGTVNLATDGGFTYKHDGSNTLTDGFSYSATDGSTTSTANVTITVGADQPPVAAPDAYTVAEGGTLDVPAAGAPSLFANDSDVDTPIAQWQVQIVSGPTHATSFTTKANGGFTYVHDGSETTSDSFTYKTFDGIAASAPVTVTITVTPVNDAPTATADAYSTLEDQPLTVAAATGVLTNDNDVDTPRASLKAVLVTNVAHGTLVLNNDGSFTYTPAANYNGADSFTYKANDGSLDSNVVTVSLTITAVNDAPSFTNSGNVTVLEDAGAQSITWASAISAGPADEAGQSLTFSLTSNTNPALFSVQPSIDATGKLTFTANANANGAATVQVSLKDNGGVANGGADTSATVALTINVTAVNDVPSFTKGANQTINEDSSAQTVTGWATAMNAGAADEVAQTLNFIVSNDNNALFSVQPAIDASGNLTYTPAPNAFGLANVSVQIHDNGGTANGGVDTSAVQQFTITITGINDVPSFTKGADRTVLEDAGAQTFIGWATGISAGPGNESTQTVHFNITNNTNAALFAVQPAVAPNGTLTFTTAANANGSATITLNIQDNGGTANGGVDTSATQTFVINVTPVNDAPSFTKGANQTIAEDSGAQTVNGWATAMLAGPGDELGQTLNFIVSNDNTALFSVQPAIDASGNLTYTPAANANGVANVTVQIHDNGGVANGGVDTSASQVFVITITGVNDKPVLTFPASVTTNEDAPLAFTAANLISGSDVDANGGSESVSLTVTNGTMTVTPPAGVSVTGNGTSNITMSGSLANLNATLATLSYLPNANYNGSDSLQLVLNDNGNTGSGGAKSDSQTVAITVTPVNDAPTATLPAAQTVLEDATLTFSTGNSNAITVADVDAGSGIVSLNLTTANGTITVGSTAGLNSNANNGTGNVTITGTVAALNASLQGTVFTPTANFSGAASIAVTVDDNGNTGSGGAMQFNGSITVNVTPVNDVPSFTKGVDQTVLEDAVTQSVNGWATAISAGPGEGSQTVDFIVTNDNNSLFAVQPAVDATGKLTYTLAANANGVANVSVKIHDNGGTTNGGVDLSGAQTFTITVTAVNDAPSFTNGSDQTVLEDSGAQTVSGFASNLTAGPGDESGQALDFIVTNNNTSLFSVQPAIDASGNLTYTPAANAFGNATVTVKIHDNGGTANGGADTSAGQTFVINVTAVNDAPSFTKGANQTVLEDATAQSVSGWATGISAGPNEGSQTVDFVVTNDNNSLFSVQPAVDASGTLTYTLAANANGVANVSVKIHDDGGTTNGGVDLSGAQSFTITVTAVNDAPSFTNGSDQTVLEDSGAQTVSGFASNRSAGPGDESGQALNFIVSNNNTTLFSVQPAIDASGNLTYTPAANAFGTATVSVQIHDNGGTANGGVDTSAVQTFAITVTGVNDAPSFTKGTDQTVLEDALAQTVNGWATGISAGPNETGQTVHFNVTNNNNSLFSVQPAVGPTGTLTYTLAPNANGSATVTINVQDDGGTANSGVDQSSDQTFTINVTAVNDAPSFAKGADETVLEDSGAHTVANWASGMTAGPGDESGQSLTMFTNCTNASLFSVTPTVNVVTGTLSYTLAANAFGSSTCTTHLQDNGGTANGGVDDSGNQTFTITVTGVNDAPSFTKGTDQTVLEDAGAQTVNGWATGISAGPNEGTQTVTFTVTNNNNSLFSVQPAVSSTGVLTYTPAANANGSATVTINAQDDGGTANGGVNVSAQQTFVINVTAVNDAPSFTFAAPHVYIMADSGDNILPNWVQNRSTGPADESGQTLTAFMTNNNNALFTTQPTVDMTNGWLSCTVKPGASGTATISLYIQDNGGTANGGSDTSATLTFTLSVEASPKVTSTSPSEGGTIARSAPITFNFSEPVTATASAFTVTCGSTTQSFTMSASPASSYTLTPAVSQSSLWTAGNCVAKALSSQIKDVDTDDPPDGMDTDFTLNFITNTPPSAVADAYNALGNVTLTINAAQGLLANDSDPDAGQTLTVTAGTFATSGGGSITIAADGSFTYQTAANASSGTDTYTYTVSDGSASATAVITFTITGRYIYVQHDAAAGGNGRDVTPYQTITQAEAVATTGDTILVLTGGAGSMDDGFTLKNNQLLIGQGIAPSLTTTLNGNTVTLLTAGTAPTITRSTAGATATLGSGNTVKGLSITSTNGAALTGTNFGTLTTDRLSLTSVGGAAITLDTGSFAAGSIISSATASASVNGVAFTSVGGSLAINGGTLTNSTNTNFLVNGGTVSITYLGGMTSNTGGSLVTVTGNHATGTLTFQTGAIGATAGNGLQLTAANGTYIFNGNTNLTGGSAQISVGGTGTFVFSNNVTVSSPSAAAFAATGAPDVTFSGTLSQTTANPLVAVTNQTGGTITFQTGVLGASSSSTGIVLNNADGTINFNSASTTLNGVNGFNINTGSSGAFTFTNSHSIATSGTGFAVDSSSLTFNYPGSITANTAKAVSVNALSGGAVTFSGTITSGTSGSPSGLGISVTNSTGGSVTFSGSKSLFTGGNPAVTLTSNSGSTINFSGGNLGITTTSGAGFTATGGGTVNVTGANNTVSTGSGIGVNINATTVGVSGVTFLSVNVNGAAANGITLNGIGNVGTFTVSGSGSAGTGGTIQGTSGAAVSLSSMGSSSTSLNYMNLNGSGTGAALSGSAFGTLAVNGVALANPGNFQVVSLATGTVNGTFSSIGGTINGNVVGAVFNAVGGTFTVSGGTLTSGSSPQTPDLLQITGGNATITWSGSLVSNKAGTMVNVSGTHTGSLTLNGVLTASGGSLGLVFTSANGAYTINPAAVTNFTGAANALSIFTSSGVFSTSSNLAPVNLTGTAVRIGDSSSSTVAGSPVVLFNGAMSQSTGPKLVEIHGVTGGSGSGIATPYSIRFNGNITKTIGTAGPGINVSTVSGPIGVGTSVGFTGTINMNTGSGTGINVTNCGANASTTFTGDVTLTSTSGTAVNLATNPNHTINFTPGANNLVISTTTTGGGIIASGGGTVNVGGTSNTIAVGDGTSAVNPAISISNTTIGATGLQFQSVSANGGANGIVLNTTGASGSLVIAGDGTTTRNSSGGTIQNQTNNGISLTSTLAPSFSHVLVQNTTHSGVKGTTVTGFTYQHGTITNSGISAAAVVVGTTDDSNIAFNTVVAGSENNLSGAYTIKNNLLSNAYYRGIDIYNFAGTVTDGQIVNNTVTSIADTTKSKGAGIRVVTEKNAQFTKGTIDANAVNNFPTDVGIDVPCGTAGFATPVVCGTFNTTPGSGTNIINITNNVLTGNSAALPFGAEGIVAYVNTGQGNFNISGNQITNTKGQGISSSAFGNAQVSGLFNGNTLVTHNTFAAAGIGVGTSFATAAGAAESPIYRMTITNNNISQNDGNDILVVARDVNGTVFAKIQNNTCAAPLTGARPGLRVDSGNSNGNNTVNLKITGNTTAGSGSVAGIGLRRQTTNTNVFAIDGMAATASPNVEAYVGNGGGLNPGTANGVADGSFNGVLLLSGTTGFSNVAFPY